MSDTETMKSTSKNSFDSLISAIMDAGGGPVESMTVEYRSGKAGLAVSVAVRFRLWKRPDGEAA